jgi:hypothetical protein
VYQAPQPPPDSSKRFLNLSAGALIAVVTGILLVCCVGPIALCFFSPFLAGLSEGTKTKPDAAITACRIESGGSPASATVGLRVTNKGASTESYLVKVEIRDGSGARVGNGSELVSSLAPGSSATEETVVFLGSGEGATCHIVGIS